MDEPLQGLLDTSILIELLKGRQPAKDWFSEQGRLGFTPISWMETVQGARNLREERMILKYLKRFEMVYLIEVDQAWAMQQLVAHHLKFNVGFADCLIASASQRLKVPLYTLNMKHFKPILGNLAQRPF